MTHIYNCAAIANVAIKGILTFSLYFKNVQKIMSVLRIPTGRYQFILKVETVMRIGVHLMTHIYDCTAVAKSS